jgi:hypothetical protein
MFCEAIATTNDNGKPMLMIALKKEARRGPLRLRQTQGTPDRSNKSVDKAAGLPTTNAASTA